MKEGEREDESLLNLNWRFFRPKRTDGNKRASVARITISLSLSLLDSIFSLPLLPSFLFLSRSLLSFTSWIQRLDFTTFIRPNLVRILSTLNFLLHFRNKTLDSSWCVFFVSFRERNQKDPHFLQQLLNVMPSPFSVHPPLLLLFFDDWSVHWLIETCLRWWKYLKICNQNILILTWNLQGQDLSVFFSPINIHDIFLAMMMCDFKTNFFRFQFHSIWLEIGKEWKWETHLSSSLIGL